MNCTKQNKTARDVFMYSIYLQLLHKSVIVRHDKIDDNNIIVEECLSRPPLITQLYVLR